MRNVFASAAVVLVAVAASQVDAQSCGNPLGGYCGNANGVSACCPSGSYCQPWDTVYYQCITVPSGCSALEPDVDYFGNDIASVSNIQPWDCCARCQATAGCNFFTFVNLDPNGPTCYLKSAKGASVRKVGALSGRRTPTPTPTPTPTLSPAPSTCSNSLGGYCGNESGVSACCPTGSYCQPWDKYYYQCLAVPITCGAYETDVDYYGGDVGSVANIQPWECCAKCNENPACKFFTYVSADTQGSTCYLKSSSAGRTRKVGALSGARVAVAPTSPVPTAPITTAPTTAPPSGSQCVQHLKNIFYHGFDIAEVVLTDPELCCAACAKTPGCVLYSLLMSSATGVNRCVLKSQASNDKTNYGDSRTVTAYSGFVKNPLPVAL